MAINIARMLRPRSIAVAGGVWADNVISQCLKSDFQGDVWPIHPEHKTVQGLKCYSSLSSLPGAPDAVFLGVNRYSTVELVAELSAMGAGGAVCFAAGFSEASAEDDDAELLQQSLVDAAGDMPIIGPNCYGLINYVDGALLWPDQHGGVRVSNGVAILTQSSNIAINLTMQTRGLPIAYVLTVGNQAQMSLGQLGASLLEDDRVTALALHIEGFGDIVSFENMAKRAKKLGKTIVAIKVGRSDQARQAMVSHTNSMSGSDASSEAWLKRLGIVRLQSLSVMIETLKILHILGPLEGTSLQSMSCSGGEASLMADAVNGTDLRYPELDRDQTKDLRAALGPLVALSNPLDYHTFIWDDLDRMTATFSAMMQARVSLSVLVLDFPRGDRCEYVSWNKAIEALKAARDATDARVAVLATLPENLPEEVAIQLNGMGIVPLCGIEDSVSAIVAAIEAGEAQRSEVQAPVLFSNQPDSPSRLVTEADARRFFNDTALRFPMTRFYNGLAELETDLSSDSKPIEFPVVLKGLGIAHKTEANAVVLNLQSQDAIIDAATRMIGLETGASITGFQIEQYISDSVAELLVSIVRDTNGCLLLTLAAGGIVTELLDDKVHLLVPFERVHLASALDQLRVTRLLDGYRGKPAADRDKIIESIMAIQNWSIEHADTLLELEINPLICGCSDAIAADILLNMSGD